jgi:hypothetical protein
MTGRRCGFCDKRAVWRWKPRQPPPVYNQFLCDDHAASIDLDELEDLITPEWSP